LFPRKLSAVGPLVPARDARNSGKLSRSLRHATATHAALSLDLKRVLPAGSREARSPRWRLAAAAWVEQICRDSLQSPWRTIFHTITPPRTIKPVFALELLIL
ncbi:hypothetical protein CLOP_g14257, partial [Closterium sp. NIES-67]